jgi:hypothetical protein
MLLDVPCKAGKLQATDDGSLRVQAPFNKTVWQVPRDTVTGFTTQPGALGAVNVTVHTTQEMYQAEMVAKQNLEKLLALFPHLQTTTAGREWYHDPAKLTHVETYTNQKKMQKEVEAAGQFGWVPQTSAGVGSHINVGRTVTKFALTGGLGLMTGASRSKDKITITFVRTQNWLDQHR